MDKRNLQGLFERELSLLSQFKVSIDFKVLPVNNFWNGVGRDKREDE